MLRLTMVTLWIGAVSHGLLGVAAISNGEGDDNVPVRRQRPKSLLGVDSPAPGKQIEGESLLKLGEEENDYGDDDDDDDADEADQSDALGEAGVSSEAGEDEGDYECNILHLFNVHESCQDVNYNNPPVCSSTQYSSTGPLSFF